jgi:hypothetical protein
MTVNTRGANADVTLNLANDVAGAVTIAPAAGTIRDVNYRNVSAAAQTPAMPASFRNLTLTLDNAPVTLAATTLSGTLNVTAGGAIPTPARSPSPAPRRSPLAHEQHHARQRERRRQRAHRQRERRDIERRNARAPAAGAVTRASGLR